MKVGEICTRDVVTVGRDATLRDAATLMRRRHVGALVVVEESGDYEVPLGVLTDRDVVVAVVAEGVGLDDVTAGDAMSSPVVTARVDDELLAALERMREEAVRRMPVVDAKGALAGIVSADDVLGLLARELAEMYALVVRGQRREVERRS